jgi:hypothetical protein
MKVEFGWAEWPGEEPVRAVVIQTGTEAEGCTHSLTKAGAKWLVKELRRAVAEWDEAEKAGN